MKVVIKDLDTLEKGIKKAVENSLVNVVAPNVKQLLSDYAEEKVYGAYEPFVYERSYSLTNGKDYTYEVEKTGDTKISISVNHPFGKLIEYGDGVDGMHYMYPFNRDHTEYKFMNPRPFFRSTVDELKSGTFRELLVDALKQYSFLNIK